MYKAEVENQTGRKIKCLQSDNGTEYLTKLFNDFLKENGIARRLIVPYTPQQNGTAELKNRTHATEHMSQAARSLSIPVLF